MKVYHASKFIIESPDIYHSRDLLDFGKGFYLTSLVEQAKKYAQRFLFQGDKAYLNQYILDENLDREYKIKEFIGYNVITAKPKAHAFKNEMCFPLTKTKCELKKHPNSKFECFFNDFNRTKTSLFLPFPSKLIQDNLVCVLELQE